MRTNVLNTLRLSAGRGHRYSKLLCNINKVLKVLSVVT